MCRPSTTPHHHNRRAGLCPRKTRARTGGSRSHLFSPVFQMGPTRRDRIPAFRVALGVTIAMSTLLALGCLDLAIYANFGAFTGVYGRHATRELRLKHNVLAGSR